MRTTGDARSEITLFKACEAKGGFTKEAADYYDHYHDVAGYDAKIQELFGYNPSELK